MYRNVFHVRHKAVAGRKIPHQRTGPCNRARDDTPTGQAHEVHVVGVLTQAICRRAVVEVGVTDQAERLGVSSQVFLPGVLVQDIGNPCLKSSETGVSRHGKPGGP